MLLLLALGWPERVAGSQGAGSAPAPAKKAGGTDKTGPATKDSQKAKKSTGKDKDQDKDAGKDGEQEPDTDAGEESDAPAGGGKKASPPAKSAGAGATPPAGGEGGKARGEGQTAPLSIDDEYVQENLESFLHPTSIKWLPDGRVNLVFDFQKKEPEHETIFTQKISSETQSKFRWTVRWEDGWTGTDTSKSDDVRWYDGGLRMGMDGRVLLNCWFTDDVEALVYYAQYVSFNPKHFFALAFSPDGNKMIGGNYGTQAISMAGGRIEKRKGTVEQVANNQGFKMLLKVKDGTFEVHRDGRLKEKLDYSKKAYASGRLGFSWGGGVAIICPKIEITGRIDSKKMAQELRKASRKK